MTQRPADVPSLPLSVTCTADAVFADAIVALATRLAGAGASSGPDEAASPTPGARRFIDAVQAGVTACLSHLGGSERDLSIGLSSDATHWVGDFRWQADPAGGATLTGLEATLSDLADTVTCGLDGADAHCEVRCRRD